MNNKNLSLFLLRLGLGVLFFWAGWEKLTAATPFTAAGYLNSASGPFAEIFKSFAGNTTIDLLVAWGLTLGGLALVLGLFTRLASIGLAILMALIYLSHFPPNAPDGLVDQHIIYILTLAVLGYHNAGKIWGLSGKVTLPHYLLE